MHSKLKRGLSALLAVLLLLSFVPNFALADDNASRIVVSDATGDAGKEVQVSVSIENNPGGFYAAAFAVIYDTEALTLTNVVAGSIFNDEPTIYNGALDFSHPDSGMGGEISDGLIHMVVDGDWATAHDTDGELVVLTFLIHNSASGEYTIGLVPNGATLGLENGYFLDSDYSEMEGTIVVPGTITVAGGLSAHTISKADGFDVANGDISFDPATAYLDDTVTITVASIAEYRLVQDSLTVTYGAAVSVSDLAQDPDDPAKFTFTMPDADVVVSAEFEPIPTYEVSVDGMLENGKITLLLDAVEGIEELRYEAKAGDTIEVLVEADEHYRLKAGSLTADGEAITTTGHATNTYTFTMPDEDVVVSAQFELIPSHKITSSVETVGDGTGEIDVFDEAVEGTTVTIKAVPGADSMLMEKMFSVVGDESKNTIPTSLKSLNTYTFTMPAEAVTINATFGDTSLKSHLWGGEGTAEEPYTISSVEGFLDFRDRVNKGEDYEDYFFLLKADLDITKHEANFALIEDFQGTFDGGGKTINVSIIRNSPTVDYDVRIALFRKANVIKNLTVDGEIVGYGGAAGIVFDVNEIDNCTNRANVNSPRGSAAGVAHDANTVTNCINYGHVVGGRITGAGIARNATLVSDCINYGSITGPQVTVAGIISTIGRDGVVKNCVNYGTLSGSVTAAGIAATNDAAGTSKIINSSNHGTISTDGYNSHTAAGIILQPRNNTVIENCYNTGNISISATPDSANAIIAVGGIVGTMRFFTGEITIKNCYSTGSLSTNKAGINGTLYEPGGMVGYSGMVGYVGTRQITLENCYYLEGTATNAVSFGDATVTGDAPAMSEAYMKSATFVTALNAGGDAYGAPEGSKNDAYPILTWEGSVKNETLRVSANNSGGTTTAKVEGTELAAQKDEDGLYSAVVDATTHVAYSNAAKTATTTIENDSLRELAKVDGSLEIKTDVGTIKFDVATIARIANAAGDDKPVVLEITSIAEDTIKNSTAIEQIAPDGTTKFYSFTLTIGGSPHLTDTKATNSITVSVPGKRETPTTSGYFEAYYIPTSGAPKAIRASDAGGFITFVTNHFSDYAVKFIAPVAGDTPNTQSDTKKQGPQSTTWDGKSLDVTWFDASQNVFTIRTAAEFAGLAALVNGIYNNGITDIYGDASLIKDNSNIGSSGGQNVSTDLYHYGDYDFAGKTVYLAADLDMGASNNYMPIGGQYLMVPGDTTTKIGSSFNGTLDGQGHSVTIYCDRWSSNYGDGQSVGVIGRLGVHDNDPTSMYATPAVRNLIVYGSVHANRSVGGVVGKIGQTAGTAIIESCANYANVSNTDAKGVGGIVGAGWNNGKIINCYNAGNIRSTYMCPTGGISGSNEVIIENCYNVGNISCVAPSFAMAIGTNNAIMPEVINSYYLKDSATGGGYFSNMTGIGNGAYEKTAAEMKDEAFIALLNEGDTNAYTKDTGYNSGYPILTFGAKPADNKNDTNDSGGGTVVDNSSLNAEFGEDKVPLSDAPDQLVTIESNTTTSNGEATSKVTEAEIKTAVESAKDDDKLGIAIAPKNVGDDVTKLVVEIPTASVETIADAELSLVINTPIGNLTFEGDAVAAIVSGAGSGDTVQIIVEAVDESKLGDAQKDAIGDRPAFDLTVKSGNTVISSFGTGRVIVTIPYTLKEGESPEGLRVFHVAADGTRTEIACTYNRNISSIIFVVNHFSVYVIDYDASAVWTNPFTDVKESDWFYDAVKFVSSQGLMNGTGADKFAPSANLTRAMLVTILYRAEGEPTVTGNGGFTDVPSGQWYSNAIAWAAENGIVNGVGDDKFSPNGNITREQLSTILHRYAAFKGETVTSNGDLSVYLDGAKTSSWAADAMKWAVGTGLINGTSATTVDPQGTATRAQVATILMRYIKK